MRYQNAGPGGGPIVAGYPTGEDYPLCLADYDMQCLAVSGTYGLFLSQSAHFTQSPLFVMEFLYFYILRQIGGGGDYCCSGEKAPLKRRGLFTSEALTPPLEMDCRNYRMMEQADL